MASREKRPLAPSKSKQKASDDSGLSSTPQNKRKRSLPALRKQQLARDFLEAVAGGSQLSPKLESALPSKKVLRSLRHKQKLKNSKSNLIKVKVSKIVPISGSHDLHRRQVGVTNRLKIKKARRLAKAKLNATKITEQRDGDDVDGNVDNETIGKSSKNNLRTKKTKSGIRVTEETEIVPSTDRETCDTGVVANPKNSPKTTRKLKTAETPESPARTAKTSKIPLTKRNAIKDSESTAKQTRSVGKDSENAATSGKSASASPETKNRKKSSSVSSSVDLTIEEVVSSMVGDTEHEDCQVAGGKVTRSRRMLMDEKPTADIEIKKEIIEAEDDNSETASESQTSIQLRQRSGNSFGQRSLRNGKLRQLSDSGLGPELDVKKRRWLNMDESNAAESGTENSVDNASDVNMETEYSFSESSTNENPSNALSGKDETSSMKLESPTDFDETVESGMEMENNNNSERIDRSGDEVGPILRSKTKAKSTELEVKLEDADVEDPRPLGRSLAGQLEPRKSGSLDQLRKDGHAKIPTDGKPPKSRRSSLNIDMKKTMSSLYGNEKPENPSKSHIDLMIETIKLGIAKSIESKISRSEKSLVMNKNFEVPKIEEIVAPLSAESQKLGLEEIADENKPNASMNEAASNSSENSVPKVADTAKEIEKLVMGEIESIDTQNSESASSELATDEKRAFEKRQSSDNNEAGMSRTVENTEKINDDDVNEANFGNVEKSVDNDNACEQKDGKKSIVTRKSPRNKSSNDGNVDGDCGGKSTTSTDDGEKAKTETGDEDPKKEDEKEANLGPSEDVEVRESSLECRSEDSNVVDVPSSIDAADEIKENEPHSQETETETAEIIETAENAEEENETKDENADKTAIDQNISLENDVSKNDEAKSDAEDNTTDKINADDNLPSMCEDTETLESISEEVERLVSETATTDSARSETSDVPENPENSKTESDPNVEKSSTTADDEKTVEVEKIEVSKDEEPSPMASEPDETALIHDSPEVRASTAISPCDETEAFDASKDRETDCSTDVPHSESSEKIPSKENIDRTREPTESRSEIAKPRSEKNAEEPKSTAEENRRVLRARDKVKKVEAKTGETKQSTKSSESHETIVKVEIEPNEPEETSENFTTDDTDNKPDKSENSEISQATIKIEEPEPSVRTRRSREVKRRKEEPAQTQNTPKSKRSRRDVRRSDQQNKEETLLDDEVATINENNRSLVDGKNHGGSENLRGFSEGGRAPVDKIPTVVDENRSKSENDLETVKSKSACSDRLSRARPESETPKDNVNENPDGRPDSDCKIAKTLESSQKDSDDASTSGESSSSSTINSMIHETPEDKARKESILRLLGLESLEKAAERLNHQKAKKEQYTGTLKTVIRVQKNKDKKRSRSPLKMVLKQGRGDGDGDSPEFYTIQKEFGASGMGDSSSGANRKFSTNHRHSCDENNEEAPPKDRQSLVIPEKSASFSIHPGRCCADVCCHCGGKFGSLDTPMHLAQMKSDERRQKILNMEKLLNEDSCICDACYRRVDRKANTSPTNMQTKPHRQLMVLKCSARDCREPARHSVKRRWLQRIKARVHNQVDINWESSQHTSIPFCVHHYSKIVPYLMCALCKRRLAKNNIHRLAPTETDELNHSLPRQGIPVHLVGGTFVCKHCRYFTQLQLKYKYVQNMNIGLRTFFKDYRIRMLKRYDVAFFDCDEDDALPGTSRDESLPGTSKDKDKDKDKAKKKVKCNPTKIAGPSKSPDRATTSTSEKSTPEPTVKISEVGNFETENENRSIKAITNEVSISRESQLMDLESTVAKLKKRKALEQHVFPSETSITAETRGSDVVEILAMDKEVTLTRLPKRPRVSSDITPVVQRLGANPSISVRTLFPGEEEMNLHANVEFANVREITPQGWEKCATMIQYDRETKLLWQELQRPYGNQSSFLRHLILLEKYYRSGDLVLAPNASRNAINYSTSVQNRLISYEGPEKMDEPIMEPISAEYSSSRRLTGGYMMERDRLSLPGTSASILTSSAGKTTFSTITTTSTASNADANPTVAKTSPPRVLKLNSGVSIIKKPPPSLQRLSLPSGSSTNGGIGNRREPSGHGKMIPIMSGGKVFQLSEAELERLQDLKRQKQLMTKMIPVQSGGKVFQLSENEWKRIQDLKQQKQLTSEHKQSTNSSSSVGGGNSGGSNASSSTKTGSVAAHYQKAQTAAQTQFQKHLRMQQEMLNRQSRGDFEPIICDVRTLNENTPTQNLINNLNLPKSIQVTTKPSNPIPILPKIPKSLTVIPQTVSRPLDK